MDVLGNSGTSEFQKIFRQQYPDIASSSDGLLNRIRYFGYNTPKKMDSFFEDMVKFGGLNGSIAVRYP
jgi:urocanate hydratase